MQIISNIKQLPYTSTLLLFYHLIMMKSRKKALVSVGQDLSIMVIIVSAWYVQTILWLQKQQKWWKLWRRLILGLGLSISLQIGYWKWGEDDTCQTYVFGGHILFIVVIFNIELDQVLAFIVEYQMVLSPPKMVLCELLN